LIVAVNRLTACQTRLAADLLRITGARRFGAWLVDTLTAASRVRYRSPHHRRTPDDVAAAAATGTRRRVLSDPTPDGHLDPLNTHRSAEAPWCPQSVLDIVVAARRSASLQTQELAEAIVAATPVRRSFRRRSPSAPVLRPCAAFRNTLSRPVSGRFVCTHRHSCASELTARGPGLRCDISTPDDLAVARLSDGTATTRAVTLSGTSRG